MKKRITSFGSLEPLVIRDGKIVTELATFNSEGKSHKHDQWEICYVLSGQGRIIYKWGVEREIKITEVETGAIVKIPPIAKFLPSFAVSSV